MQSPWMNRFQTIRVVVIAGVVVLIGIMWLIRR
jgi:hypothetical protein